MKMTRRIGMALILAFTFVFNACASGGEIEVLPTEANVKFLGRSIVKNDMLLMCHSGTGIAFEVDAKSLSVEIAGDSNTRGYEDLQSGARVVAFVNGERKLDVIIGNKLQTYTIFDEKKPVKGEVRIVKVSESANSLAAISKMIINKDGFIKPAAEKSLKIEFIGDSITCGYGVDDLDRNHHFATSTEDNSKTYAYKTAEALNADYSMVSVSGWGVISGYTNGSKNSGSTIPSIYNKLGFSWGSTILGINPKMEEWDFARFEPDFVVINLGTNDNSYVKGNEKRKEEFKAGYIKFIKTVRKRNPEAKIICALGMMGGDLYSSIDNAVSEYKTETGDEKVCSLFLKNQNMADGIAADWHPSEKTHEKSAQTLISCINSMY